MKQFVLLLGATGQSGFHIAQKLLAEGYPVRILARSIQKVQKLFKEREIAFESIIQGDINDEEILKKAFQPSDHYGSIKIVISALGQILGSKQTSQQIQYITQIKIVDLCKQQKVTRYILVSAALMQRPWHPITVFLNLLISDVYFWKAKAQNYIRQSGLNYTIVRPPQLVGNHQIIEKTGYDIGQGDKISGKLTRSTLAEIVFHTLACENIGNRITFECAENRKKQCEIGEFQTLKQDTQANIVKASPHKTAKRTYQMGFLLMLGFGVKLLLWRFQAQQ